MVFTLLAIPLGTLLLTSNGPTAPLSRGRSSTPSTTDQRFSTSTASTAASSADAFSVSEKIAEEIAKSDPESRVVVPTPVAGVSIRTMPGETPPLLAWVLGIDAERETLVIRRAQLLPADEFGDPSGPAILRAVGPDYETLPYATGASVSDTSGESSLGTLMPASNLYWIDRENDIVTRLTQQPLRELEPPSDLVE